MTRYTFGWLFAVVLLATGKSEEKRHPVIGILAETTSSNMKEYGDSYIYAAYVKFIEQAGGLVVPIRTEEPKEYYEAIFRKLNGVIFPGGAQSLVSSSYARSAEYFFNMSMEAHSNRDVFPILGICLGFQQLTALPTQTNLLHVCNGTDVSLSLIFTPGICLGFEEMTVRRTIDCLLTHCDALDYASSLTFTNEAKKSRLFHDLPDDLHEALEKWNITYNNHQYCLTTETYSKNRILSKFYKVLSTNTAKDGTKYVSTIEAYNYPFYGVQWHPEKSIYLWSDSHVNHSAAAVKVAQYIADFFVNEARKSHHVYEVDDLAASVIFNYQPRFMGVPSFHNIYFFHKPSLFSWYRQILDFGTFMMVGFLLLLIFVHLMGRRHRPEANYVTQLPDNKILLINEK